MKKRLLACTLAATMVLGSTAPVLAADDGSTQGTNTFVDGGTDLSFWTFQELHVGFWTSMADEWNKQNPDRPINLTVTAESVFPSPAIPEKPISAIPSSYLNII